jgi:hypothetical protein
LSTITAILEPNADGTLHLPLPPELRNGKVKVTASLEPANETRTPPVATAEMLQKRTDALATLRALGALKDVIPDPVAWQREQRSAPPLPVASSVDRSLAQA